jgi:flagellar motor switch protein FliM
MSKVSWQRTTDIKKVDFRSPKKFKKEQYKSLESLHETLARNLTSMITALTRHFSEITIVSIEKMRYLEYSNLLPERVIMANVDLVPSDVSIDEISMMISIQPEIGFFLIDRLLGGNGDNLCLQREYTELELSVLDAFLRRFDHPIEMSWSKYLEIETRFKALEANPRMVQLMALEDVVLVVTYRIIIGNITSTITLCLPSLPMELLIEKFTPRYIRPVKRLGESKDEASRMAILQSLKNADVELCVTLDQIELDLHDILQLEVNDVIPLNKHYDSNVVLSVDEIPWFEAKLGETKLRKAIKIERLIERGQ